MHSPKSKIIALLTDFGEADWYVGVLRATILSSTPKANFFDITHQVPPGNIQAGAFALLCAQPSLPKNCIVIGVVDPGVGSNRQPIAIETKHQCFIGPDNGLFSYAVKDQEILDIRKIESPHLPPNPSNTFHGRDIFAPAAALLAQGHPFSSLGKPLPSFHSLDWQTTQKTGTVVTGKIMYIDHFGNAITSLKPQEWRGSKPQVTIGQTVCSIQATYSSVPKNQPLALVGSTGFLEISVNQGNAATQLDVKIGDLVYIEHEKD